MPLIKDMPAEEYHKIEAFSASGGKNLLKSTAYFAFCKQNPPQPTANMLLGTVVHSLVLEPHLVEKTYAISPKFDKRTTAGKAAHADFEAKAGGRTVVDEAVFATASAMAESVKRHPLYSDIFSDIEPEVTMLWSEMGFENKARMDAIKGNLIIDLKTAQDASAEGFAKAVASFRYQLQAAHYIAGYKACTGEAPQHFIFVAVESEAPYNVGVYTLDEEAIEIGSFMRGMAMGRYEDYLAGTYDTNYTRDVRVLSLPKWAAPEEFHEWKSIKG